MTWTGSTSAVAASILTAFVSLAPRSIPPQIADPLRPDQALTDEMTQLNEDELSDDHLEKVAGATDGTKGLSLGDLVSSVLPWPFHKDLPASADLPAPAPSEPIPKQTKET
jgi:hypothetical protein